MRARYLFDLAHICHVSPPLVDALRLLDFIQLICGIDAYYEREAKKWQSEE